MRSWENSCVGWPRSRWFSPEKL